MDSTLGFEGKTDLICPIICDPAVTFTGKRSLLLEVSQKAMDLNFEGLMIETHPNPDEAWSDAAQQVTGDGLHDILNNLVLRSKEISVDALSVLEDMRSKNCYSG